MKYSFIISVFLLFTVLSCSKDKNNSECNCSVAGQECATVVKVAANCDNWGIEISGKQYSATNVPSQFQVVGTKVCVAYTLYTDFRLCACCGGTWADISSMSKSN
jgi:hypothetical protein